MAMLSICLIYNHSFGIFVQFDSIKFDLVSNFFFLMVDFDLTLPVEVHSPGGMGTSLSRLPFMSLGPAHGTSDTVAFVFFSHVISHLFSQLHWKEFPRRSLIHDGERSVAVKKIRVRRWMDRFI